VSDTLPFPLPFPLYRADRQGLKPGQLISRRRALGDGREYTSATSNFDLARAFAVRRWCETGVKRSVYQVELDYPFRDAHYAEETGAGCWEALSGAVVRLVEDDVGMTLDEANAVLSLHAVWIGRLTESGTSENTSPMYDADGYAARRNVDPELRQLFRGLGQYPDPTRVHETWSGYLV
jgi:hypothetical protein